MTLSFKGWPKRNVSTNWNWSTGREIYLFNESVYLWRLYPTDYLTNPSWIHGEVSQLRQWPSHVYPITYDTRQRQLLVMAVEQPLMNSSLRALPVWVQKINAGGSYFRPNSSSSTTLLHRHWWLQRTGCRERRSLTPPTCVRCAGHLRRAVIFTTATRRRMTTAITTDSPPRCRGQILLSFDLFPAYHTTPLFIIMNWSSILN